MNCTCSGQPSICMRDAAFNANSTYTPTTSPSTGGVEQGDSCVDFRCSDDSYCAANNQCLPQQVNNLACSKDEQCLSGICGPDDKCGLPALHACSTNVACRSAICELGFCVDLAATPQGSTLLNCNAAGFSTSGGGAAPAIPWLAALGVSLICRRLRRSLPRGKCKPGGRILWLWMLTLAPLRVLAPRTVAAHNVQSKLTESGTGLQILPGFDLLPLPVQQIMTPYMFTDACAAPRAGFGGAHALTLRLGVVSGYQTLILRNSSTGKILGAPVSVQSTLRATVSYWWRERLRLSASLPLQIVAAGHGTFSGGNGLAAAGRVGRWNYALVLGLIGYSSPTRHILGLVLASLTLQPAVGVALGENYQWHLGLEVPMATGVQAGYPLFGENKSWVEPTLGVAYQPASR